MGLSTSLIMIMGFIVVYTIIVEIYVVLFRITGLTEEKARFQVISLLTNSGFTTQESEIITGHTTRRKIAKAAMITGYVVSVIIVSLVVNMLLNLKVDDLNRSLLAIMIAFFVMIVLLFIMKISWIKKRFPRFIEIISNHFMLTGQGNIVTVLDTYGLMVIAEVKIKKMPIELKNKKIGETELRKKYDIMLMLVKSGLQDPKTVNAQTVIMQFDTVVLFGPLKNIKEVFENVN